MHAFMNKAIIATLCAALPLVAIAAPSHYADVKEGVWYDFAAESMLEDGYLDASKTLFHPDNRVTRAEALKIIVMMNGGILNKPPARKSFDDVSVNDWHYPYMEEAAHEKWIQGAGNCLGSHPCFVYPNRAITRGEAAVLIVRAFGLEGTGDYPRLVDVDESDWFSDAVHTMADHCLMQGDDTSGKIRPYEPTSRAEMIVLLHRVDQFQTYGSDCGQ